MVNYKGLVSYCQECGACAACEALGNTRQIEPRMLEQIVDEVVRSIQGETAGAGRPDSGPPRIPLGVSNRHAHLTAETFARLFGEGAAFGVYRELYQPGEFASKHTVTIVGSKMRAIQSVRILGPLRDYDQVELSLTDSIQIGVKPPVRNSGDLHDAAPLTLVGPAGSVYLPRCAIIASRHVHMTDAEAAVFGVQSGDYCRVRIPGDKATIFENVRVRTHDSWKMQLHLDTDDANAANVRCATQVEFAGKMEPYSP